MDNQPDHNQPRFGDFGESQPLDISGPTRLSLLAIASLVTGILSLVGCCVPVVGAIPTGLGIGALFAIHRSRGRVAGRGLAIAGLLTGVLGLIISTGLWIGVSSVGGRIGPVYSQAFDPDPAVVRTVLTSSQASKISDEEIARFQAELATAHPGTVEIPSGFAKLYTGFGKVGEDPSAYQNLRTNEGLSFPFPATNGDEWFYVVVLMSPAEKLGSGLPGLADVGFLGQDGSIVWLVEDADSQSPPAGPTDDGAGTPPPETPTGDPGG